MGRMGQQIAVVARGNGVKRIALGTVLINTRGKVPHRLFPAYEKHLKWIQSSSGCNDLGGGPRYRVRGEVAIGCPQDLRNLSHCQGGSTKVTHGLLSHHSGFKGKFAHKDR